MTNGTRKSVSSDPRVEEHRRKNREWARAHHVPHRRSAQDRLWGNVLKTPLCWVWLGGLSLGNRYGSIVVNGKDIGAHKFAWESLNGPVPKGLELDHLCRNRRCVRPDHLEPVTHAENMRRGNGFAGLNARKTHCAKHGIPLVSLPGGEGRGCRPCRREANVRYRIRLGGTGSLSEGIKRRWANTPAWRKAEISRKIWETRRRNAAA